jgi:hypothetical protein
MRPQASLPFHSIVQILAGYYFPSYDLNLFTDSDIEETVMARVVLRKLPRSAFHKKGRDIMKGKSEAKKFTILMRSKKISIFTNVHTDIKLLREAGLIKLDHNEKIFVPWRKINTEIDLLTAA